MGKARSSPLIAALRLLVDRGGELLAPPGSEAGIALLAALGGWQLGLAMPTEVTLIRLVRVLFTQGPAAFASGLQGLEAPSRLFVAVTLVLAAAVVALSGGWIRAALALARGDDVGSDTWSDGMYGMPRVVGWNLATLGWIGGLGLLIGQLGLFAVHAGVAGASAGSPVVPSLVGTAGAALWVFGLGAAIYYFAVACLGAVVAIAEPETPFWSLFRRAPAVFTAGGGGRGLVDVAVLLGGWWLVKVAVSQLLVAPGPVRFGMQAEIYGIGAAVLMTGLALGDVLVLLIAILIAAVVYERGREGRESRSPVPKKNSRGRQTR